MGISEAKKRRKKSRPAPAVAPDSDQEMDELEVKLPFRKRKQVASAARKKQQPMKQPPQDGSESSSSSDSDAVTAPKKKTKLLAESDSSESERDDDESPAKKQMFVDDDQDDSSSDDGADGFKNKGLESDSSDEEAEMEDENTEEVSKVMELFQLPEGEDEDADPATIKKRISEILGSLSNFRELAKRGQSRSDFVDQLISDCSRFYGYLPSLIELFLTLFSPDEMVEFLESNETSRSVVIRTNTLKTKRRDLAKALTARGVNLEPLADWSNVGLKIFESTVPIGATPEYLAGHYMLQSASSFTPVLALDPKPGERILDMASAPGGKTSYIAQLMRNTGTIIANDRNRDRIAATSSNCARLGVRNVIHVSHDGRQFPKVMGGFDRVLLDAPCSGLGVIQRDPSVKISRTMDDIRTTAKLQKQLLLSAIDSCTCKSTSGGIVVYSTCSISAEENEMVAQYALEKRDVIIVDAGLGESFGRPGLVKYKGHRFHPSMKHCRRFYSHVHNMDGFFFVKFKKLSAKGSVLVPDSKQSTEETDDVEGQEEEEQRKASSSRTNDVTEKKEVTKKKTTRKEKKDTPELAENTIKKKVLTKKARQLPKKRAAKSTKTKGKDGRLRDETRTEKAKLESLSDNKNTPLGIDKRKKTKKDSKVEKSPEKQISNKMKKKRKSKN